ncbi:hypothetical protein DL766_003005 [Monosporascus sp. MC13-8B]|uniref:CID domain-containing protein n=1 Tax=Monosporascus cannonballus TaxID=155416 RepID=A0ABY0GW48_9PEZI|nr:hypothetical protein DL762_008436 [Monosporascus cannonballus]RYO81197.1 hypothetical protein DL763_008643 [Monosporascus cannonballus]RYP34356.1 hypothetical protein DL766_003005 [Monosporascus sp. MC13-8B]
MSSYTESEDVAADFREALEDIQFNSRYEIQNLTVIARENTEHALAISGALVEHVKRTAPQKKLPALYVLDSIVKNVGTPYTLFFGRKLYQTFMDAYASVDNATRRKMDEMLKTWKEPIPGSIDPRPVFPPEVVRPIENALIKARTNALQAQQERARGQQQILGQGRAMPQAIPHRDVPTPPTTRPPQANGLPYPGQPSMPTANGASYGNPAPPMTNYSPYPNQPPSRSTPQPPAASSAFQPPQSGGYGVPQAGISIEALNGDIHKLIAASQAQIAQSPHDPSIQTRLKALMDLQTILQTQNLPPDQAPPAQTSTPIPQPQPVAVAPPPAAAPKISLDSLFGSGSLAALMARTSATPQVSTPQPPPATAAIRSPIPQRAEPQKPATPVQTDPKSLMEMLRKAGMLPPPPSTNGAAPVPSATQSIPLPFPLRIPGQIPAAGHPRPPTLENLTSEIELKASSLKQFRPHLLPFLFEALGPQCSQCGRRFTTDEEGKKKKTAHMDWHFKVNRRIAEAEKRGQHRSWLVDKMDWINTRETIDEDHVAQEEDGDSSSGAAPSKTPKVQYIPVPDDPVLANSICPICQEKFETRWLDDAQDFVWPDAIKVGQRVYHASCHREATKDERNAPKYARSTPEPVLGKRKAEQDELTSLRGKVKVEAA